MSENLGFERASSVTLGIVVILLYAVFVSAVFSGFATYIYRSEWVASLSADADGAQDIDNLIFTIRRADTLESDLIRTRAQLPDIRTDLEAARSTFATTQDEVNKFANLSNTLPFEVSAALSSYSALLEADKQAELTALLGDGKVVLKTRAVEGSKYFINTLRGVQGDDVSDAVGRISQYQAQLSAGNRRELALAQAGRSVTQLSAELEALEVREAQFKLQIEELPLTESQMAAGRARLAALYTDFPMVGDSFQRMVSFPTIFLTLIVTIAAGGLGTVVAFSRTYHTSAEAPSLARLFVNVGEGIAAAIAIFLFSGAGMLAFAQGAGAQGAVELSPYTVAFIAFVSGFMAEDAFGAIQKAGKNFFKQSAPVVPEAPVVDPVPEVVDEPKPAPVAAQ